MKQSHQNILSVHNSSPSFASAFFAKHGPRCGNDSIAVSGCPANHRTAEMPKSTQEGAWMKLVLVYCALGLMSLLYVSPSLVMLVGSLKTDQRVLIEAGSMLALWPHEANLNNYADVFHRVPFFHYLFNSLLITGTIVLSGLLVNAMAGYVIARMSFVVFSDLDVHI